MLIIWSNSDTFIHKENRSYSTIILLYQLKCQRSWHPRALLAFRSVSVTFIHKEHCSYLTVVLLHKFIHPRSQHVRRLLAFLVSFCLFCATSCHICNIFINDQSFKSNLTGKEYKTISYDRLSCGSTNVIYGIHMFIVVLFM